MADEELKKAFHELQVKVIDTTQQVKVTEAKIEQLKRSIAHAQLTEQELSGLPAGIKTYENLGRTFVAQSISDIKSALRERTNIANDKIENLNLNKSFLEKNLKESEDNIREMIQHRRK